MAVISNTFQGDGAPLVASIAFSTLAFSMTFAFIRWSGPAFAKAGLKGKDMSKLRPVEMYLNSPTACKARPHTDVSIVPKAWELLQHQFTFWH